MVSKPYKVFLRPVPLRVSHRRSFNPFDIEGVIKQLCKQSLLGAPVLLTKLRAGLDGDLRSRSVKYKPILNVYRVYEIWMMGGDNNLVVALLLYQKRRQEIDRIDP